MSLEKKNKKEVSYMQLQGSVFISYSMYLSYNTTILAKS